ncbi:9139_t:CDS:2 [Funneliformis geosporum]|nr:9139_t:CDS:2 [Funneliformis geosporum]
MSRNSRSLLDISNRVIVLKSNDLFNSNTKTRTINIERIIKEINEAWNNADDRINNVLPYRIQPDFLAKLKRNIKLEARRLQKKLSKEHEAVRLMNLNSGNSLANYSRIVQLPPKAIQLCICMRSNKFMTLYIF